jgi:hypothetical protein
MGANDGPVDDLLAMAEGWQSESGDGVMPESPAPSSKDMLESIAEQFSATQMRQLGERLVKLADSLDQAWRPSDVRSTYHWITAAGRIERESLALAKVAVRLRTAAKHRTRHLSSAYLGEPYWEMLLELFIQFAGGAKVSTKALCIVSGTSDTTALRMIVQLEEAGLVVRAPSSLDRRVTLVSLTREGVVAIGSILLEAAD